MSSPSSPVHAQRLGEKEKLGWLNSRLENYIRANQALREQVEALEKDIKSLRDTEHDEALRVKSLYEREIHEMRTVLDETARDKAECQMKTNSLVDEVADLKKRLGAESRLHKQADARASKMATDLDRALAQASSLKDDRDRATAELAEAAKERDSLRAELAALKKDFDLESLRRVNFENDCLTLRDSLVFAKKEHREVVSVLQKENAAMKKRLQTHEDDMRRECDKKVAQAVEAAKRAADEKRGLLIIELESKFEHRVTLLQQQVEREKSACAGLLSRVGELENVVDQLTEQLKKCRDNCQKLESRVSDLNNTLRQERESHTTDLRNRDRRLADAQRQMDEQLNAMDDLTSVKLSLEKELKTYQKLLELEEKRLGISGHAPPSDDDAAGPSSSAPPRTPSPPASPPTSDTTTPSRKRRRVAETVVKARVVKHGSAVTFESLDVEGAFVRLENTQASPAKLDGWSLESTVAGKTVVYKFPKNTEVEGKSTVTVWTGKSAYNARSKPAGDLFWAQKTVPWDQHEATVELKNTQKRVVSKIQVTQSEADELFGSRGDPTPRSPGSSSPHGAAGAGAADKDNCSIM